MASGGEEGICFELTVRYSVTSKHSTGPKDHTNILKYMQKEISSFRKFIATVEEIKFIRITYISKPEKSDRHSKPEKSDGHFLMGFYVSDVDQLERFYQVSHKTEKNNVNDLSYSLTDYFRNQERLIACELASNTTINFKVIMDNDTRQDLEKKLQQKKGSGASSLPGGSGNTHPITQTDKDNSDVQENPQNNSDSHIVMTFIVDADETRLKSVRILCNTIKELNSEIFRKRKNIYSVDIRIPSSYNPDAIYWYEFTYHTHGLWFLRSTKEIKTNLFTVGNRTVHRDSIMNVYTHFEDIVHYNDFEFSEPELCMQIEDLVHNYCFTTDVQAVLSYLLQTGLESSSRKLVRFSLVVGNLCEGYSYKIKLAILPKIANEMLESLLTRRLSEFPVSASKYLPHLCITLLEIAYDKRFCAFLCIEKMRSFLSTKEMIDILHGYITKRKYIVCSDPSCVSTVTGACNYYFEKYLSEESNEYIDICSLMLRHLPFELALDCYKSLKNTYRISEEAFTALNANIRSRIISASKEALKERKSLELFEITMKAGGLMLTDDSIIRETLQDSIIHCFATFHIPTSVDLKLTVDNILKYSGCFTDCEAQKQLLQSIAESKTASSRQLFIDLSRYSMFEKAFCELDVETYVICFSSRRNNTEGRGNEIFNIFTALNEFTKIFAVQTRSELREALEAETMHNLNKYTLKELVQNIEKIENLCDCDDTIARLYKEQVQQLLTRKGMTSVEVLSLFCTGDRLRVNSRTTADIVSVIVNLFFKDLLQINANDVFISLLKHVQFWEVLKKGEGTLVCQVQENEVVRHVQACLCKVANLLKQDETDLSFLTQIEIHDERTRHLLHLGGFADADVRSLNDRFTKRKREMAVRFSNVLTVLKSVQKQKIPAVQSSLDITLLKVEEINRRFKEGSISIKECSKVSWLWGDLDKLPELCAVLRPVIESNVFWNLGRQSTLDAYTQRSDVAGLDVCISIRFLFDDHNTDEYDEILDEMKANENTTLFLTCLQEKGLGIYEESWKTLGVDTDIAMVPVMKMFENTCVPEEIKTANLFLKKPLNKEVEKTLLQLSRRAEVINKADAMRSVLLALGYNILKDTDMQEALGSFQKLINQDLSQSSLHDVRVCLDTIFALAEVLTDDTLSIMAEIGKSTILVEFLKEIAVEDVRNLIDAVEDISESHVQESTVSALIEVKRFLVPLLNASLVNEKGSRWIFHTLQKQTEGIEGNAGSLPGKISDCMLNIHNLKSLYDNVANRGQQTKEIIKSILTKGKFCFKLISDEEKVTVEVSYKDNKNQYTKQESSIIDMRSRALLLLNTERHSKESSFNQAEFGDFIKCVDTCLETRDILSDLFSSGHIQYSYVNIKCSTQKELIKTKSRLREELDDWLKQMHTARSKYYLMNFIQGFQIHSINDYLNHNLGEENVNTILKFINPNLSAKQLKLKYLDSNFSCSDFLEQLGVALHAIYDGNELFCRKIGSKEKGKKITDSVQTGKLLVAHVDENSEYVIRTVMALYQNTTDCLPEPNQLLFCSDNTTWSDIELLIQRCTRAQEFYGTIPLFCVANVELLQNEVQFRLVDTLQQLEDNLNFRMAVICCGSKSQLFVDQLSDRLCTIQPMSENTVESIYHSHFKNVLTFTSEVAGLGKSASIKKRAMDVDRSTVVVHVSGNFKRTELIDRLNGLNIKAYHVLHLDIGNVDYPNLLDTFLFELIVMKIVSTSRKSVCLKTEHVCIEIANTISNALKNKLQTSTSFIREHLLWRDFSDFLPSLEINSPVQVVCHYLQKLDDNLLDREDLKFTVVKPLLATTCRTLLRKHLSHISDISFSIVNIFLNVLADQLKKLSSSIFFNVSRISEMIGDAMVPSVRSNLVKAMVEVSIEFASRSVNACRSTQNSTVSGEKQDKKAFSDKLVERVDCMIRWEDSNHLIYVFHNQNIQTLSPMYRDKLKVPQHIKQLFESQMKRSLQDFSSMDQQQLQGMLERVARSNPEHLSAAKLKEISKEYALTPDNLLKMVLIMMRIQSKVPVVIMGETGCGKTSLIRYLANMCEVQFCVLNIHAGVNTKQIEETVLKEHMSSLINTKEQRWLFLDEINTSESIGLICDIICHQRCRGTLLSPNLVIMGACNPYKLRSVSAIKTAGLSEKVRTDELSKLVYRVLPLPEMMVDYVWDFGSLSINDEKKYIERMVEGVFKAGSVKHYLLRDVLSLSQCFVREKEKSACVVSLRDVQRCKSLIIWFQKTLKLKTLKVRLNKQSECDLDIKAIILALAHCYHSRFVDKDVRCEYRKRLLLGFQQNGISSFAENDIHDVIKEEQMDIIERMNLPEGTARNTALQENIFVILVCILNRIPIFVVGKPGCSKSLAMQVIRSNLRGRDSKDPFFKHLPQLYCVSFQGSESSTSDGIIKVFERAEIYQKDNSKDSVLSVVILDEIGLAEISKFNPLKVLHNLLEPDGLSVPNVAVVGISNWALDASKMNRAIHLSRPDMDEEELYETAISISSSFIENTNVQTGLTWTQKEEKLSIEEIKNELRLVAHSYSAYIQKLQFKNFHGLRDFYSLVKYISRKFANVFKSLSVESKAAAIMEGLLRNFGGLKTGRYDLIYHFNGCFVSSTNMSCSAVIDLIRSNITDDMARHLMIITKGESVMGLVDQILRESGRDKKEIIFGSQFEEDLTDDYNYRILSRIILCMEQGIVLVLKDLDHIYGSLYDMLNQNYTRIGKKNNCRIALGPYSNPFCHVAESFRCIVLVDENQLDYSDPPFLNRFEKQFLTFSDIMKDDESMIVDEIKTWVKNLTTIEGMPFSADNAFPYYNEELVVSLVIRENRKPDMKNREHFVDSCKRELLWIMRPEVVVRLSNVVEPGIIKDSDAIKQEYFDLPLHDGFGCFFKHQINKGELLTVIFTYSNIHTKLSEELSDIKYQTEKLGAFKSEKQLSLKLQQFWKNEETDVLLVHCSAVEDDRHIMLTKSLIEKQATEHYEQVSSVRSKYVFLVIHLIGNSLQMDQMLEAVNSASSSISQINYLSGWKLVLLDSLQKPKISLPQLCSRTLRETVESLKPLSKYLKEELFWSFTRIQYGPSGRDVESIRNIMSKMSSSDIFLNIISDYIWTIIKGSLTGEEDQYWCLRVACDIESLNTSTHFTDALERKIRQVIRTPFTKLIYRLEVMGSLDSFFEEDEHSQKRIEFWSSNLRNEKMMELTSVNDVTGPACFLCNTPDLKLKMPFSLCMFENIEKSKDSFIDEVVRTKVKCGLESDESLPDEIFAELVSQHESYLLTKLPDLIETNTYMGLNDDYITDFCNINSQTFSNTISKEKRIHYMKWAIGYKMKMEQQDFFTLCAHIHCAGWTHYSVINSYFVLLELCQNIFKIDALELFQVARGSKKTGKPNEESSQSSLPSSNEFFNQDDDKEVYPDADLDNITDVFKNSNKIEKFANLEVGSAELETYYGSKAKIESAVLCTESTTADEQAFRENGNSITTMQKLERQTDHLTELKESLHISEEKDMTDVKAKFPDLKICNDENEESITTEVHNMKGIEADNSLSKNYDFIPHNAQDGSKQETTETSQPNDADEDIFNDLVAFVCKTILPTLDNMQSFSNIEHWQMTARNVLVLASDVSADCPELHALRLCNDIVSECLFPVENNSRLLEKLAMSIEEYGIDSEVVFSELLSILNDSENTGSSLKKHRIMCQFLIRCLSTDPRTEAYRFLFSAIIDSKIPEKDMQMLKAPLQYLIQQELVENDGILLEILEGGEDVTHIVEEQSVFLFHLDVCLKTLKQTDSNYFQFEILIVDLLQETFEIDAVDMRCGELILSSGKCLQQEESSLRFITAVAFLKEAIFHIARNLNENIYEQIPSVLVDFNAVLSGLEGNPMCKYLLEYFVKCLFSYSSVHTTFKICESLEHQHTFVRSIHWAEDCLNTLEENPFCMHPIGTEMKESKRLMRKDQNTDSFRQNVGKLLEMSSKNLKYKDLIVFATAMHEFYMPRSRRSLDDTDRSRAETFYELLKTKYTDKKTALLECLLGRRDFEISELRHGEETSLQQVMINSVIISTQILSFCVQVSDAVEYSLFKACLLRPMLMKNVYLPAFQNDTAFFPEPSMPTEIFETTEMILCKCETRLAIHKVSDRNLACVICRRKFSFKEKQSNFKVACDKHADPKPGINSNDKVTELMHPIRQLSAVSVNIVQLLVKGCLLGSLNIHTSTLSEIKELFGFISPEDGQQDVQLWLLNQIRQHWINLGQLLNMNNHDVGSFLQLIIVKAEHHLFYNQNPLTTIQQREIWEDTFEGIVSKLLKSRAKSINDARREHIQLFSLPFHSIEVAILEVEEINETANDKTRLDMRLKEILRVPSKPLMTDFVCQLWTIREEFPFLSRVIEIEDNLRLPKNIYNIVQWHLTTVVKTSYKMKRQECLRMSVQEFLDKQKDTGQIQTLRVRFSALQKSWIELKKKSGCNSHLNTLKEINFETKMADCLILNEDSELYKVLVFLINIQNDFIDMALKQAFKCRNLQFLLRNEHICCIKSIPVTELKKEHLLEMKFEWTRNLAQESNSRLQYGLGRQVEYDFNNIEKELAVELLIKGAYINLKALPNIIFVDELYRNFVELIKYVQESVRQESLPNDMENFFVKKNKEHPNMSLELLHHLDMIFTLLKKTKCDSQQPLKEFVQERAIILGQSFPTQYLPIPESRLKLCHVVSLHEVLEEISADRVIGGFPYTFNTELEEDLKTHLTKSTMSSIRRTEFVLKAIKRFIYRCMYMGDSDPEERLLHYLSHPSFWPAKLFKNGKLCIDNKEEDLADIIPTTVRVCQVAELVKKMHSDIEKQREGEVRMDHVITTWKNKSDQTAKVSRQKRAVMKLRKS